MKGNGIKKRLLIIVDILIFIVSYYLSFVITTSLESSAFILEKFVQTLPAVIIVKYLIFHFVGVFKDITSYLSIHQMQNIIKASIWSSLFIFSLSAFYQGVTGIGGFPPYVFLIDCLCATFLLAVKRILPFSFWGKGKMFGKKDLTRVLIVGAGEAGELVVHAMMKSHRMPYLPVCFVDDDSYKIGKHIHGIPVVGTIAEIENITKEKYIDEILIAIASASGKEIRRIIESAKKLKIPITTVPSLADLISGKARVEEIRKVNKNDLLRREPIRIDTTKVRDYLYGRSILITGAGGSIGSELARQVCRFSPTKLYLLDHSEVSLFAVLQDLKRLQHDVDVVPLLANITDLEKMEKIVAAARPEIIFHTAAYKHVSLLEAFPQEAFKNNVVGTKYLAQLALKEGVKRFVLVSTDKAVDPMCVMGFTKKIAELYVRGLAFSGVVSTKFLAVRFGNVLGSTGSVVTIFEDQIRHKENLTVTHPEAMRYFMTIEEATQLIMQAGVMGSGGEVFLLKMGEAVKILDLAKNLIILSGFVPDEDIKIVYTGLKPGEKLNEKLVGETEIELPTIHNEITVIKDSVEYSFERLDQEITDLERTFRATDGTTLVDELYKIASFPTYPVFK